MLIKSKPDPERDARLQRFHEDAVWFKTHRKELVAQYPDQWVAVYRKEVVGVDEDPELLMMRLKANCGSIGSIYFGFAATKPKVWVI